MTTEERKGRRGNDLVQASVELLGSNKPLSAIIAEYDLK